MNYCFLADLIIALHLAYAGYVLFGYLLTLLGLAFGWRWIRNFPFRLSHLICTVLVGLEAAGGIACPLTVLENYFLRLAGSPGYERSFIGNLMVRLLYYEAPEEYFAVIYIAWTLLVVLTYVLAPPVRKRRSASLPVG